jgi:circadian clock protein KaiB
VVSHDSPLSLRLYVSGQALNSRTAIRNLDALRKSLDAATEVEVVDVREHPDMAEADRILATPTLVRRSPKPVRKIIGDLSDVERVVTGLELGTGSGT